MSAFVEIADLGTVIMPITSCPPGGTLTRRQGGGAYCSYPETEPLYARNDVLIKRLNEVGAQIQSACAFAGGQRWEPMREVCPQGPPGSPIGWAMISASGVRCPEVRDPRCLDQHNASRWGTTARPSPTVQALEAEHFQIKGEIESNWARINDFEAKARQQAVDVSAILKADAINQRTRIGGPDVVRADWLLKQRGGVLLDGQTAETSPCPPGLSRTAVGCRQLGQVQPGLDTKGLLIAGALVAGGLGVAAWIMTRKKPVAP